MVCKVEKNASDSEPMVITIFTSPSLFTSNHPKSLNNLVTVACLTKCKEK